MNIYTVSFFGHRYIECGTEIENRLDKLLHDLITQKEYVDFLIGRNGVKSQVKHTIIRQKIYKPFATKYTRLMRDGFAVREAV